ncbi:hypothetical protein ANANG_G00064010 [Anguilla anguilla]|uniref:ITPR-interacting domain-containing protein n=1 Tax=Anguilla anguilla TaxID=7936 RepID=A0A9D3S2T6_ANGAN|nr:hypothetical protein ANANG_G00064010 [Anguilla anguilla]
MEQCGSAGRGHPWKAATMKRKAWALSRGSWQASESQDGHAEGQPPQEPGAHKVPLAEEPGRIPNKIASWLKECRTPLGASLDEQSNTPTKGTVKNTCSFEDDLSLGAEANHLRAGGTPSEMQHLGMLAKEKRTQFQQKGRSMNSTGSGKSNTTVSSVSELLDLYEEDPEEILYNLGFGREEPDIASKIPSRFFNSMSHARGIDIKVYLGAQLQRLELENPNYALTSRFRQIEVLTTVANAFSSLYSQVSGTPVQKIGSTETEHKEPPPLNRNNSALNAAKILKKTFTRRNLHASVDGGPSAHPEAERGKGPGESGHEQSPRTKDLHSLATVTEAEESRLGPTGVMPADPPNGDLPNGDKEEDEEPNSNPAKDSSLSADPDTDRGKEQAVTSTPAKEPPTHRPHPCISHLLSQAKDSFEMEEVQSNEGEGPAGISSSSKDGNELLQRMASQHSDSSGFAEDPSTDGSANHLKVQESSDSCDSETTVTSNAGELSTPLAVDHPIFHKFPGEEEGLTAFGSDSAPMLDHHAFQKPEGEEEGQTAAGPDSSGELNTDLLSGNQSQPKGEEEEVLVEEKEVVQENVAEEKADEENVVEEVVEEKVVEEDVGEEEVAEEKVVEQEIVEEEEVKEVIPEYIPHPTHVHKPVEPSSSEGPGSPAEPLAQTSSTTEPGPEDTQDRPHVAPCWPPQAAPACEEHGALVWARVRDLQMGRDRYPLRRSSSLPTPLLSPSRVVSSVKIQLRPGSARHCTPPSYSYRYTPEDEGEDGTGSIAEKEEEEEDEEGAPCRSTLVINATPKAREVPEELRAEDIPPSRMPPYPLHIPAHLTRSSCSLHSTPPDWLERPLCDLPRSWSTCSMPALSAHSAPYGSPFSHSHSAPYSSTLSHPQSATYGLPVGHLHSAPYGSPLGQTHSAPYSSPLGQTHSAPYSWPLGHPHNAPYGPPLGHSHSAPYSLPLSHPHNAPYGPPLGQPHRAPYSSPLGHPHNAPHHYGIPQSNRCNSPFSSPYVAPCSSNCCPAYPAPCGPVAPLRLAHPPSSTEMQLKRVLHDVRSAVQNLAQGSSRSEDMVNPLFNPHRAVQPLYEDTIQELQVIKRNLNVFRTQMMDLELALLRQQDMVYQHLTEEDRQEAEHLQSLRTAVRQELQELELQLEDRLLFLDEQLRASHYRHPVGLSRGHSLDSRCSTPPMNVTEPVTELLREQLSLQAELGFEGRASSVPPLGSSCSSESVGPARPSRPPGPSVHDCPSPQRLDVYRTSISLTPTLPPRQQTPGPPQRADSVPICPSPEDGGGAGAVREGGAVENPQLQQLIKEIKRSITEEIRQEIVSDLLAAVLPRRSPAATQEHTL